MYFAGREDFRLPFTLHLPRALCLLRSLTSFPQTSQMGKALRGNCDSITGFALIVPRLRSKSLERNPGARLWAGALLLLLVFSMWQGVVRIPTANAAGQGTCFGNNGVDDSFIPAIVRSLRIAVLMPVFTSTPYSQYNYGSFYAFYTKYANAQGNITTDLGWLSTPVSSGYGYDGGWGLSYGLYQFLSSQTASSCGLTLGGNVQVLDDINVSAGALYNRDGSARFDVLVAPFSEYVTTNESQAFERFVAGGGTLVMPGSHSIEWPVVYNPATKTETFTQGHNFAWNGKTAWPSTCGDKHFATCPWAANYNDWVASEPVGATGIKFNGSTTNANNVIGKALAKEFGSVVFKPYKAHEENVVTNMTGTSIISTFSNQSIGLVASYVHDFGKGRVVCMCVFGDDIIGTDPSAQYFLSLGIISASLYPQVACTGSSCTVTVEGWGPTGSVSWSSDGKSSVSPATCQLSGGSCSVTISGSAGITSLLTVRYSGDPQNAPSTNAFSWSAANGVTKAPPSLTASSTASTSATSVTSDGTFTVTGQTGSSGIGLLEVSLALVAVMVLAGAVLVLRRK